MLAAIHATGVGAIRRKNDSVPINEKARTANAPSLGGQANLRMIVSRNLACAAFGCDMPENEAGDFDLRNDFAGGDLRIGIMVAAHPNPAAASLKGLDLFSVELRDLCRCRVVVKTVA